MNINITRTHHGEIVGTYNNLTVIYCEVCNLRHLSPIPRTTMYKSGAFYKVEKPDYAKEYSLDARWWEAIYGDWLSLVTPLAPNANLLDVGSGTGQFLDAAERNGFFATGLEPDHSLASRRQDTLWCEYQDYSGNDYGVVSAHWTIEHFSDPSYFLGWTRQRLAPNGVLLITIPNDFSLIQFDAMTVVERPYYWLHKTHINYWNASEFREYLTRRGYEVKHIYGSWQPERYLMEGKNYLDDHLLGRELHTKRKEDDLEVSRQYRLSKYLLMGEQGWGRDLTFVAVKR